MASLWFKQKYVRAILDGVKKDTIRKPGSKPYRVGDLLTLMVGPRPPFATAVVVGYDNVDAADLGDRLPAVRSFYGDHPSYPVVRFRLLKVSHEAPEVVKASAAI